MAQTQAPKIKTDSHTMMVRPRTVEVRSESDPGKSYVVTLPFCPCKDFHWRHLQGDADPFCKHLKAALATVAGWQAPKPEPEVFADLTHTAAKELLQSGLVGFSPREANAVLLFAANHQEAPFSRSGGSPMDGTLTYDRLLSRYTLAVIR